MVDLAGIKAPSFDGKKFDIFTEMIQHYVDATSITDEKQKLAVLFTCLGSDGYAVYRTIRQTETDSTLKAALELLEKHCTPTKNETFEPHKFRLRKQGKHESVDEYVTALRHLARDCKFEALQVEAIRDQLVEGTNSVRVQERLLTEKDLELEKAISIVRTAELAREQVQELSKRDTPLHRCQLSGIGRSEICSKNFFLNREVAKKNFYAF